MTKLIDNQRAVFVLGMHRSGTSALSRILNLMGVELGIESEEGGKDNQRGFWEHPELALINENILNSMDSSWHDLRALPERWWEKDSLLPFVGKIEEILDQQFSQSPIWGLKDPRLCLLLPLWLNILKRRNCQPSFVCITRHPIEVMYSLRKRNKFSSWKGYLLWLNYTLAAERESRDYPRVFVTYNDLLTKSKTVIEHISKSLGLPLSENREALFEKAKDFLSTDLRHERADHESLSNVDPLHQLVEQAYEALLKTSFQNENGLLRSLEEVQNRWDEIEPEILPLIQENESFVFQVIQHERSKRLTKRLSKKIKEMTGIFS